MPSSAGDNLYSWDVFGKCALYLLHQMSALSTHQLALVIAMEIQQNIVEKSQAGHVAQDAMTAPK